jgi:hypothetical protein
MNDRRRSLEDKNLRRTQRGEKTTGRARVKRTGREVSRERGPIDEGRRAGSQRPARTTESRPVHRPERRDTDREDRRRGGIPWWVWLLGLLALGVVLFMVFAGNIGDSDSSQSSGESTSTSSATNDGTLSAGGTDLLPLASSGGDLAQYEGETVDGRSVQVESVVSDEGFWVGDGSEERVFVLLDLAGESGPDFDAGDRLDLSGTVTTAPEGFADDLGVTSEEGADLLGQQGTYVEATEVELAT